MITIFDKRNIVVLGMAESGKAVATLLALKGFDVKIFDDNAQAIEEFMREDTLNGQIEPVAPDRGEDAVDRADLLVISPGVPMDHPLVERARMKSIDVAGELEVAYQFCSTKLIAVTGTNGKSTVTDLIGCILKAAGLNSIIAGNIGLPFSTVASSGRQLDAAVLEVSSFQLDTISRFKADVAVLLNVTPDHLDRYEDSFDTYAESKKRILNRADENTWFVYNDEDAVCRRFAAEHMGHRIPFSSKKTLNRGVYEREGKIVRKWEGDEETIISRAEFNPVGVHNLENALAAVAAATAVNIEKDAIVAALKAYVPLPHRMELVGVVDGVRYINDSKATNVDAAVKSIQSIEEGLILILGGRDKNGDFTVLRPYLQHVKKAILIGEARDAISGSISGSCPTEFADSMEEAVKNAGMSAVPGDTVLLAPACASFDMFENYKDRGKVFRACVNQLPGIKQ
jgi:UDP-N-acetylmuramoylalanine--D-glutamate ligase